MELAVFDKLLDRRLALTKEVLANKSKEYSTDDKFHNFKTAARVNGVTPAQALWGMTSKHLVSVMDLVNGIKKPTKELVDEKIGDMVNYLILLEGILNE